ncbi:MAG: YqeG family HAD IIIA-type phosphatase [Lachnospiraceae bacterium]|nr:YqeG family HAD IIIA-type phosphatase [Lachnospiraceae bacterium]
MISLLFPGKAAKSVFDIDYQALYNEGRRGLLFDIDNTLVHHGDDSTPEVDALFERINSIGFRTLMLSNNNKERIERFLKNIDADYIDEAGKPDPAAYLEACRRLGVRPDQAVMIGDQLFTDIRGANRAGIDSILVDFIRLPGEKWLGWHRYAEFLILGAWRFCRGAAAMCKMPGRVFSILNRLRKREILFCDISPTTYRISVEKENLKKSLRDLKSHERFAAQRTKELLPCVASVHQSNMIRRAPGIDLTLQQNKAVNMDLASHTFNHLVIHPGESFSFWHCVGPTTEKRGYKKGRVIREGKLVPGFGGGLCNLANTLHLLVLESPLTVTELHFHSDALAPGEGPRHPLSSGTSVSYRNIDFRFRNDTDQDFQIISLCKGEMHYAQLRCEHALPYTYQLVEEDHHFQKEGSRYFRVSKIYRETRDPVSGALVGRDLIRDNHSEVMFDPSLIPPELLRSSDS